MNIEITSIAEAMELWHRLQTEVRSSHSYGALRAWNACKLLADDPGGKIFISCPHNLFPTHSQKKIAELDETSQKYIHDLLMQIRAEKL